MSLDKLRTPKLSDSSRIFIPKKQKKSVIDPFVERTEKTRNKKKNKVSGGMFATRSQKASEEKRAMEVEVHPNPALNENQAGHGTEEIRNRRLTSESTLVEQGHEFVTSTGTLDREEMSELSYNSTENAAEAGSLTDKTMMYGVTEKRVTTLFFPELSICPDW